MLPWQKQIPSPTNSNIASEYTLNIVDKKVRVKSHLKGLPYLQTSVEFTKEEFSNIHYRPK